jgi:hypothetical protein
VIRDRARRSVMGRAKGKEDKGGGGEMVRRDREREGESSRVHEFTRG